MKEHAVAFAFGLYACASACACAPSPLTMVEAVGEDEAASVMNIFAARHVKASMVRVDDALFDVRVPHEEEYYAQYVLDDYANHRFARPGRYGTPLPSTQALRDKARAIEDAVRAKRGMVHASVVLLESASAAREEDKRWAYVATVFEPRDERGTAWVQEDQIVRLVAAEANLDPKQVHVRMLLHKPPRVMDAGPTLP